MTRKLQNSQSEELQYIPLEGNEVYTTYDLGCSAALISIGFELVSLDKQNQRKVLFIFARKGYIEKTVNEYFSNQLKVNARSFFDNIKSLKNRIYSSL